VGSAREPIFNLPGAVTTSVAVLALVHLARVLFPPSLDAEVLLTFAFIPARYGAGEFGFTFPGGIAADIWSIFTYAGLHGDFGHLALNLLWLVAFGAPVARRFGSGRFFALSALCAAAGAAAHFMAFPLALLPMVGASAVISGLMAAALRFMFTDRAGTGGFATGAATFQPARPLLTALRDRRVVLFLVVWFAINLLFGTGIVDITGEGDAIAWQAHIGGFLAGLFLFRFFDPVPRLLPEMEMDEPEGPGPA
jgi:membrane associated rhomboid family serine protease